MKIGVILLHTKLISIKNVTRELLLVVGGDHDLIYLPSEFEWMGETEQIGAAIEFVESCDVIFGLDADWRVLKARRQVGSTVPYVLYMLGSFLRAGHIFPIIAEYMTTNDLLIATCSAEAEIAKKFSPNAWVQVVPFSYNEDSFFTPGSAERIAFRAEMGLKPEDRLLLYSGRVTLEKNLHGLLRVFRGLQGAIPQVKLVIAGPILGHPFVEFGVVPVYFRNTVLSLSRKLGIGPDRVQFVGPVAQDHLRRLYVAADLLVNMTLHHDENFGLAQVEAMACGTPVVGTAWGGLRDTIVDGVTGYQVSTSATASGVKFNWWEAVNKIRDVLCDDTSRGNLRRSAAEYVVASYSRQVYRGNVSMVLDAARERRDRPPERLSASKFAEQMLSICDVRASDSAPYRRGARALQLYRELISPFTGVTPEWVGSDQRLESEQVLCLATPISITRPGALRADDPLFPFEIDIPPAYRQAVSAIVSVLSSVPARTVGQLLRERVCNQPNVEAAIGWMREAGLLLCTRSVSNWLAPHEIDAGIIRPLFKSQEIDRMNTDLVIY